MQVIANQERIREAVDTIKLRQGGLTNEQMANVLGFESPKTLSSRIKGESDWKLGELIKICNLYGCDPNEFFKGVEE